MEQCYKILWIPTSHKVTRTGKPQLFVRSRNAYDVIFNKQNLHNVILSMDMNRQFSSIQTIHSTEQQLSLPIHKIFSAIKNKTHKQLILASTSNPQKSLICFMDFWICFFGLFLLFVLFQNSLYSQTSLKLSDNLLLHSPKCWNYKCEPSCLTSLE